MVGSMASSRHGAGQKDAYLGFPESGTELYISQRLIKANPIRLHASLLQIIRGKLHTAVLPAFIPPTFCAVRATKFVSEANPCLHGGTCSYRDLITITFMASRQGINHSRNNSN